MHPNSNLLLVYFLFQKKKYNIDILRISDKICTNVGLYKYV